MIFTLGETFGEWYDRKHKWHKWFAWHPVCLGGTKFAWLTTLNRRYIWKHFYSEDEQYWEYKI